jgi:serine/threonine protein kinase
MQKLRNFALLPDAPIVAKELATKEGEAAHVQTDPTAQGKDDAGTAAGETDTPPQDNADKPKAASSTKRAPRPSAGRRSSTQGFAAGRGSRRFSLSSARRSSVHNVAASRVSVAPSLQSGKMSLLPATIAEDSSVVVVNDSNQEVEDGITALVHDFANVSTVDVPPAVEVVEATVSTHAPQVAATRMGLIRLALEFLSAPELLITTWAVSRAWQSASNMVASWVAASTNISLIVEMGTIKSTPNVLRNWRGLQDAFPWGCYLAEGAYKSVYKVWNAANERTEAISVMNACELAETGNEEVVRQEVQVSALLSELVTEGKCPNFIETYQVFQFAHNAPDRLWRQESAQGDPSVDDHVRRRLCNRSGKRTPRRRRKPSGRPSIFTYIRMELCDEGDLETFLRNSVEDEDDAHRELNGLLPIEEVPAVMFQMCMSLAVGQDELNLRHYDVKLLNFFVKRIDIGELAGEMEVAPEELAKDGKVEIAAYSYNNVKYRIMAPIERPFIIKLADYGTADTSPETLDDAITMAQFTTLENTPPDFFILGEQSKQDFKADSFSLGLSFLHLLTGSMPYEEILEHVVCPDEVVDAWRSGWVGPENDDDDESDDTYRALKRIVRYDEGINTVPTTLYRYFVMFGLPKHTKDRFNYKTNVVLNAFGRLLHLKRSKSSGGLMTGKGPLWNTYQKHLEEFNIFSGTNEHMKIAQGRMANIPGAETLLRGLLEYEPNLRIGMSDAIANTEMFSNMSS